MLKRQKRNLRQRGAVGDELAQILPHGKVITSCPNNPAKLKDAGTLTEEEFSSKKADLLAKL